MNNIQEYQTKKQQLEVEASNIQRQIIITEEEIKNQSETFITNFGTADLTQLNTIATQYQESINTKIAELQALEAAAGEQ